MGSSTEQPEGMRACAWTPAAAQKHQEKEPNGASFFLVGKGQPELGGKVGHAPSPLLKLENFGIFA